MDTAGPFDRDVEQVSSMKEDKRAHYEHRLILTKVPLIQLFPQKAIGSGTWLLLRQALHVYVIQRDSMGRTRASR